MDAVILGCGFTGERVARLLLASGACVLATTREPERLHELKRAGVSVIRLDVHDENMLRRLEHVTPAQAYVIHSIPPVGAGDLGLRLLEAVGPRVARMLYLSTTSVYGDQGFVDECTPPAPATERQRSRLAAERAVQGGAWSSIVLRPAAIYGPGRGVHRAMLEGSFRLVDGGNNYVSRIHVDDLATLTVAALFSDLTGAFPVADEAPCPSREIAEFCARLLGLPLPASISKSDASETRQSDRRVDGAAIRRLLGIELRYPSFRTGIPACLAEERATGKLH